MTDAERLAAMADTARAILAEALPDDRWSIDEWSSGLCVGVGGGIRPVDWSLCVSAPWTLDDRGLSLIRFGGNATPLALRVLTALDGLMWDERRTEES